MKWLVSVSSVQDQGRASWLHGDIPCGPRLPRTRSSQTEACGFVKNIGENLTPGGLQVAEARQAFTEAHLMARRKALIGTLAHLRRKHRSTSAVMADLRNVTLHILSLGDHDHGAGN